MKLEKYVPIILLSLVFLKSLVFPVYIFDAVAISAACLVFGFRLWVQHKEREADKQLQDLVESNHEYLINKLKELDTIYTDAINKVDAKVSAHFFKTDQKQQSPTISRKDFGW